MKLKMPSLPVMALATTVVLVAAFALVFFYAPNDADQGFIQKIFYLHVPLAIVSLVGFIVGGLLGHWAVWTKKAVELLEEIKRVRAEERISREWYTRNIEVTDANAAFFDPAHQFAGCIAGIHEVLRRQGLLAGRWCLDPEEELSPGQIEEIDRVYRAYPDLNDDPFVQAGLQQWLGQ